MIRKLLAVTSTLLWSLPAWAGQTTLQGKDAAAVTQYFGEVTGTIGVQATWFPMLVGCDGTTPTQCWAINSSGQLAIQAPPSLPLPSGAATSANQTAVTSAPGAPPSPAEAITVQGNASGIALPVSGTVTANAGTGSFTVAQATGANLHVVCDSGCSSSSSPSFGAAFASTGTPIGGEYFTTAPTYTNNAFMEPFTINSHGAMTVDGSAVTQPVSAASLPLPSGAATSANQTNASQKTQIVDSSGNVIGATSNALNTNVTGSAVQIAASTQAAATNPSNVVQLNPNQPSLTTPLNENIAQVGGTSVVLDACSATAHHQVAIDLLASGTTRIITGTLGKYTHICAMNFPNQPVAVSFNILEGTGTTCGTGTFAPFGGSTTSATASYALPVNGGFINNGGGAEVGYAYNASGDDVCIITNAALNGYILYVQL